MSDYTPTTEEVRNGYVAAESEPNPYVSEDERAEFDRWLAEVVREAKWVGWEEGWDARVFAETVTPTENPYRKGEEQ
jgi:hypothetical protein